MASAQDPQNQRLATFPPSLEAIWNGACSLRRCLERVEELKETAKERRSQMKKEFFVAFSFIILIAFGASAEQSIDVIQDIEGQAITTDTETGLDESCSAELAAAPDSLMSCYDKCDEEGIECEEACNFNPRCIAQCEWEWWECYIACG
jgi:hypothetical protein